ncbi:MAG TPA: hypothetical protein PKC43_07815 [Phycisphaerales bacterium]|nr:hypothetical protein [Phycisphaerales bacterium]HMP37343.1 hypothetical protein [Phycisphaerales bacterium]
MFTIPAILTALASGCASPPSTEVRAALGPGSSVEFMPDSRIAATIVNTGVSTVHIERKAKGRIGWSDATVGAGGAIVVDAEPYERILIRADATAEE